MGHLQDRRRRQLKAKGRPMLLSRADQSVSLTVQAFAPPPETGRVVDATAQQPFVAQILTDEIAAQSKLDRPRRGDRIVDNGRSYTLTDAAGVFEGPTLIGWTLIAAGGS